MYLRIFFCTILYDIGKSFLTNCFVLYQLGKYHFRRTSRCQACELLTIYAPKFLLSFCFQFGHEFGHYSLSYHALAYHALPCPALPCPALPCPALPCPALPCPALPCPALSCPQDGHIVHVSFSNIDFLRFFFQVTGHNSFGVSPELCLRWQYWLCFVVCRKRSRNIVMSTMCWKYNRRPEFLQPSSTLHITCKGLFAKTFVFWILRDWL